MRDLKCNPAAVVMNAPRHLPKARNQLVFVNAKLPPDGLPIRPNIRMTGDDQTHPSFCEPGHEIYKPGGACPVLGSHAFPRGRSYESIGQLHFLDLGGFK
jgi:hypothetical protein